jgi:succinyl-CoA synthetase beta subunit
VTKASSTAVIHKAAAGFVHLDIATTDDLRAKVESYLSKLWPADRPADGEGVVVETQRAVRYELFIGGHRDPFLGPLIIVGLGGSDVERLRQTTSALVPLSPTARERLLESAMLGRLLASRPDLRSDLDAILSRVSHWFSSNPQIVSFDINPLAVLKDGSLSCLDARVVVTR